MNQTSQPEPDQNGSTLTPASKVNGAVNEALNQSEPSRPLPNPPASTLRKSPPRSRWGLSAKLTTWTLALVTVPIVALGGLSVWAGLTLHKESQPQPNDAALQRYWTVMLAGTGGLVLASGAIATLLVRRTSQPVIRAATEANGLVNRVRRETLTLRARAGNQDELGALQTNLDILTAQIPQQLWQEEAEAERLQLLMEVTQRLRDARSEEDVMRIAVTEVRQRFRADRVTIFQLQDNGEGTFIEESVGSGWPKMLWSTIHDPCFAENYQQKYRDGLVTSIDNIHTANLTDCYIGLLERFAVQANLVAPIIRQDQLFGLMIAHQCASPRFWQASEKDLFAQIALQVGVALDHARLLEAVDQRATQAQVFIDISRRIRATLNPDDVLRVTVESVRKALEVDRVIIYSFDEDWYGTVIAEAVLPGYPKALWASIKDPCFAEGYVEQYQAGRVQATADIYQAGLTDCHLKQLEPFAVKANLVAPILREEKLYGLLIAHQCSGPRDWQGAEVDLMAQLATQVGYALDHTRLLEQVNAEGAQSKVLADITRRIRESLVEADVLKTTVAELRRAFQADRIIVYQIDDDGYGTVIAESVLPGYPKALWANIKDPCFAEGYIDKYQSGRVQATANVMRAGLTDCHIKQLKAFDVQANLVAPILKDDKLYGLLIAHQCSGPREWQSAEVELFAQLATQVGFALDHARLVAQLEQAYEVAEQSSLVQQQQRETLAQRVANWLEHSNPTVQSLSAEMLTQMEQVTSLYQFLRSLSTESQEISVSLRQQTQSLQQVQQALRDSYQTTTHLQSDLATVHQQWQQVTQQVAQLSAAAEPLGETTQHLTQLAAKLKLQAMNAALEATRMGTPAQEFASIGEKVLDLARQLDVTTQSVKTQINGLQAQQSEVAARLRQDVAPLQGSLALLDHTQAAFTQAETNTQQLESWLPEAIALVQRQSESSLTVGETVLEVATRANQASEQAMAIAATLEDLMVLTGESQGDRA